MKTHPFDGSIPWNRLTENRDVERPEDQVSETFFPVHHLGNKLQEFTKKTLQHLGASIHEIIRLKVSFHHPSQNARGIP